MSQSYPLSGWLPVAVVLAAIWVLPAAHGQVVFDGRLEFGEGQEWGSAEASALQDNYTGYGDQRLTPGGFPGSELDELFVRTDGTWLYVGVTGNLEQNGNSIILLLDVVSGGQGPELRTEIAPVVAEGACSENGPPNAVQGLGKALLRDLGALPDDPTDDTTSLDLGPSGTGTILDAGFLPDYAIAVDTNGGQVFVTQYSLSGTQLGTWDDPTTGQPGCAAPNEALPYYATRIYRGNGTVNSGSGTLTGGTNPNLSLFAFNNTGKLGVAGEAVDPPPTSGDPATQTKGLEAKIHLADLGLAVPLASDLNLKISVLLTGSNGFVSNQTLPGTGRGTDISSLGSRPDFTAVSGDQFASVIRPQAGFSAPSGSIDGTAIVANFGAAYRVASQDTVTGFGDRNCLEPTGGSELDELYVRLGEYDAVNDNQFLYIAVSGNLEGNSNANIILLDVQAGGQNTLKTEIAPEAGVSCSGNGPPSAVQGLGQALVTDPGTLPGDSTDDVTSRSTDPTATVLDEGFRPDHAITVDHTGGTLYVSHYELADEAAAFGDWDDPTTGLPDCEIIVPPSPSNETLPFFARRTYRGQIGVGSVSTGPDSLTGGSNPNGSEFAYNNTGTAGVSATAVTAAGSGLPGDPRSQTRGLEAKVSLLDLGFTAEDLPVTSLDLKIAVLLTNSGGSVSNQTLPGLGYGVVANPDLTNLGARPSFVTVAGDQYASVTGLTPSTFDPTLDGQSIVADFGTAYVVASQDTVTGYGDVTLQPVTDCDQQVTDGSEIDQMLVQDVPGALQIGITGNLEDNGNKLVIFIDSVPGAGESTLDANAGWVSGMNGDTIPLQADYALIANIFGSVVYVDLVNLNATPGSGSAYIGAEDVNTGDGILDNGGPVPDWRLFFDNTNLFGVSGDGADDPQSAAAATATTGVEISIPLTAIGEPPEGTDVCVFAIITNSGTDYLSNQILPAGLGGGRDNFDNGIDDLVAQGYTSCLHAVIGEPGPDCNDPRPDIDGDTDVDSTDFAAFQRCLTTGYLDATVTEDCACFDWNFVESNGTIDLEDLAVFLRCSFGDPDAGIGPSGPGVAANPACDEY